MKIILSKMKSISDVITKRSCEVFVMCKTDAEYYDKLKGTNGCVDIHEIAWETNQ